LHEYLIPQRRLGPSTHDHIKRQLIHGYARFHFTITHVRLYTLEYATRFLLDNFIIGHYQRLIDGITRKR
jgi:hypothetical protein